jgi:hypothetical protein
LYGKLEATQSLTYTFEAQSETSNKVLGRSTIGFSELNTNQSQDHIDLHKYFKKNKNFISEDDKIYLEQYVIKGIPSSLRRKYWMTVSGAYGYMKMYQEGYYQALCAESNDTLYPNWPHPDYLTIQKDINRTFSDEAFFKLEENQNKLKRILRAFVKRNPV